MRETKSNRIVSFIFDLQIYGAIVSVVIGASGILISSGPRSIAITIMTIGLLVSLIVYHGFLSAKSKVCTIGEKMAGAIIKDGSKKWQSPFTRSRWFLFLCLMLVFLLPSNMFDSIIEMENPPISLIASRTLYILLFICCLVQITAGKFGWSIGIFFIEGLQLFSVLTREGREQFVAKLVLYNNSISIVALLAAIIIYSLIRVNDMPKSKSEYTIPL
jgi:hypothetical protein